MHQVLQNTVSVLKVLMARARFLAVFVIAGLVVGYWDDIKNHVDKWTRPAVPPDMLAAHSEVEYYCAMHPQVVRSAPGDCPICGMPLIKRKKGEQQELPADVMARVQLSPQRVAMAGVGTTMVENRELTRSIDAIGVVDYNESAFAQLSARVSGRVDQLMLRYVGQPVNKGDPVYSLYSPEVYTAIRDYLNSRKRVNDMVGKGNEDLKMDAGDIYNASMQRLVLWGITREQLYAIYAEYDKTGNIQTHLLISSPIDGTLVERNILEGAYLEVGATPFTIADLSTLWIEAKVFERDIPLIHIGQLAKITVESLPGASFTGKVTYLDFKLDPQTRTLNARVEVANPEMKLRPGMFANVHFGLPITMQMLQANMPKVQPTTAESSPYAQTYEAALQKYLFAQKQLAGDSSEQVSAALHETAALLEPLKADAKLGPLVDRFTAAVHKTIGKDLAGLREEFKEVSQAMIDVGKAAKIPSDAPAVSIYRCPMAKADWLQPVGETSNPYYGSKMLTCGAAVEPLPRAHVIPAATTGPALQKLLAIPRSAVIDTGKRKIVYVQSSEGVFDMKQIQTGPLADGDYYPVLAGLNEGDRVVTRGAFLIDAENRLNPTTAAESPNSQEGGVPTTEAHEH